MRILVFWIYFLFIYTAHSAAYSNSVFCEKRSHDITIDEITSIETHFETKSLRTNIDQIEFSLNDNGRVKIILVENNHAKHIISGACDGKLLNIDSNAEFDFIVRDFSILVFKKRSKYYHGIIRRKLPTQSQQYFLDNLRTVYDNNNNIRFMDRGKFLNFIRKTGVSEKRILNSFDYSSMKNEFDIQRLKNSISIQIRNNSKFPLKRIQIGPIPFEIGKYDFDSNELNVSYASRHYEFTNPLNLKGPIGNLYLVIGNSGNLFRRLGDEYVANNSGYYFGNFISKQPYHMDAIGIRIDDFELAEKLVRLRESGRQLNAISNCDLERTPGRSKFLLICISKEMTILNESGVPLLKISSKKDNNGSFGPYGGWQNTLNFTND